MWTTGEDTRALHLAPRICSGGRTPDGDAVTGWYECARVQLVIPFDSSFAHPDVTAWAAAWLASLEQETTLEGLGWRMGRYHTRRDLHAAVTAAEAIPFAVSASLSRLALVPGSPPPFTIGDFIRVDVWSLTGVVVPASAGDSVRVYYRQPDGTVWTCGFVTPGRYVVAAP